MLAGISSKQGETAREKQTIPKSRPFPSHNQTIKEHNRGLRLAPPISLTKQSRLNAPGGMLWIYSGIRTCEP